MVFVSIPENIRTQGPDHNFFKIVRIKIGSTILELILIWEEGGCYWVFGDMRLG